MKDTWGVLIQIPWALSIYLCMSTLRSHVYNIKAPTFWPWPQWPQASCAALTAPPFLFHKTLKDVCQVLFHHFRLDWDFSADSRTLWLLLSVHYSREGELPPLGAPLCPTDHMARHGPSRWVSQSVDHLRQQELHNHWRQGPLDTGLTDGAPVLLLPRTAVAVCVCVCFYVCFVCMSVQIGSHNTGDDVSGVVKYDGGSPTSFVSRAALAPGHDCRQISSHVRSRVATAHELYPFWTSNPNVAVYSHLNLNRIEFLYLDRIFFFLRIRIFCFSVDQ